MSSTNIQSMFVYKVYSEHYRSSETEKIKWTEAGKAFPVRALV